MRLTLTQTARHANARAKGAHKLHVNAKIPPTDADKVVLKSLGYRCNHGLFVCFRSGSLSKSFFIIIYWKVSCLPCQAVALLLVIPWAPDYIFASHKAVRLYKYFTAGKKTGPHPFFISSWCDVTRRDALPGLGLVSVKNKKKKYCPLNFYSLIE